MKLLKSQEICCGEAREYFNPLFK